jgi:hypothetical protein
MFVQPALSMSAVSLLTRNTWNSYCVALEQRPLLTKYGRPRMADLALLLHLKHIAPLFCSCYPYLSDFIALSHISSSSAKATMRSPLAATLEVLRGVAQLLLTTYWRPSIFPHCGRRLLFLSGL